MSDSRSEDVNCSIYLVPGHIVIDLRPELLTTLRIERKPVPEDVKVTLLCSVSTKILVT